MFPGIADRMQKELTALAPSSMKVRILFFCSRLDVLLTVIVSAGQDRRSPRAQVLRLDRWFHSCFALHLPEPLVLEAGVRRVWPFDRSPQ